jgi:radical SAM superfamily enzyme YgiQ (UPF0313 family)
MKIGLVQINSRFEDQVYLPYSTGLLQAYAQTYARDPRRYIFLPPVYSRTPPAAAADQLAEADAVFFSVYVWNQNLSLAIAAALKARNPNLVTVFGGPQVPDRRPEDFLRRHPFVDVACHGEGEKTFLFLLERMKDRDWADIPSISFLSKGTLIRTAGGLPSRDLSSLPSPYLEGVFDPLLRRRAGEKWIGLWETTRGCPFSCTFCDWGSAVHSPVRAFDMDRLVRELEWFARHRVEFVYCTDANFGILPRDVEVARAAAAVKKKYGYPHVISIQSTKNVTERAYRIQEILSGTGLSKGATLSLQTSDPDALRLVRRKNIALDSFRQLQRRFQKDGIKTYTDLILGLPGETYDSFAEGVAWTIENGQHNHLQFNILSLLPNAEIADPIEQERHALETVESRLVNIHGSSSRRPGDVDETQRLVISTRSMPREDWVRANVFRWTASLLHFDKLLQIPFVLLREAGGIPYRRLIELFSNGPLAPYPLLSEIRSFFEDKARRIQSGEPEYCRSERWLNIWWPADEFVFIRLFAEERLDQFYSEAADLLRSAAPPGLPARLVGESVLLNRALLKSPRAGRNAPLTLSLNIWPFYRAALRGAPIRLEESPTRLLIDRTSAVWKTWPQWCREVVWYGSKNGAYLYENVSEEAVPSVPFVIPSSAPTHVPTPDEI